MNRCGMCKFWGEPDGHDDPDYRPCMAIKHDQYGAATTKQEADEPLNNETMEAKKQIAVLNDGSGYYAALKCKADFGCVLWETNSGPRKPN